MVCLTSLGIYASIAQLKFPTITDGEKKKLITLPSELYLQLFDLLGPADSTLLGLTCKSFYTIHRAIHGSVPLNSRTVPSREEGKGSCLREELGEVLENQEWIPYTLKYHHFGGKFFRLKRWAEVEEEWRTCEAKLAMYYAM